MLYYDIIEREKDRFATGMCWGASKYHITKIYPTFQMDAYIHSPVLAQDYFSDYEFLL